MARRTTAAGAQCSGCEIELNRLDIDEEAGEPLPNFGETEVIWRCERRWVSISSNARPTAKSRETQSTAG